MTESYDTINEEEKEEVQSPTPGESFTDLLMEMASSALSSVGKVLHAKYTIERVDGKPRKITDQ
jgi:hypothetical protein